MKIPETTANIGAYYGNEENGQWQPNGVIIDSGVGGGVVGSGDAGIHRPPIYPVHIPRGHIPGYVMAGAYYPPQYPQQAPVATPDDFADYMWMENEEEFDKQVMQQLEEEALMEQCIEAMLEDEQRERHNGHDHPTTSNGSSSLSLEETVSRSTLNPLAAEFVPTFVRACSTDEKQESPPAPEVQKTREEDSAQGSDKPEVMEDSKTEETPPQSDPPEVSAADVRPIDKSQSARTRDKRPDSKKPDVKKPAKPDSKANDTKKAKPQVVRSEPKLQPKRKEVKPVRSEAKVEEPADKVEEIVVEPAKPKRKEVKPVRSGAKVEEPADKVEEIVVEPAKPQTPVEEQTGPKPINYAAAAKANKPKKPQTPPADKTPQLKITEKTEKKIKTEKPVQRKNSAK